jgi:hypothetical protein
LATSLTPMIVQVRFIAVALPAYRLALTRGASPDILNS